MTWRSIKDDPPPKDGTRILVFTSGEILCVEWANYYLWGNRKHMSWCVPHSYQDEQDGCYDIDEFTHWQSLPPPPEDKP